MKKKILKIYKNIHGAKTRTRCDDDEVAIHNEQALSFYGDQIVEDPAVGPPTAPASQRGSIPSWGASPSAGRTCAGAPHSPVALLTADECHQESESTSLRSRGRRVARGAAVPELRHRRVLSVRP